MKRTLLIVTLLLAACENAPEGRAIVIPNDGLGALFFATMTERDVCVTEDEKSIWVYDVQTIDGQNLIFGQFAERGAPVFALKDEHTLGIFLRFADSIIPGCENVSSIDFERNPLAIDDSIENLSTRCEVSFDIVNRNEVWHLFTTDDLVCSALGVSATISEMVVDDAIENPSINKRDVPCMPVEQWREEAEVLEYRLCTGRP